MPDSGSVALQRRLMGGHCLVKLGDGGSSGVDICFADIGDLCIKPIVILGDVIGVNFTSRVCHAQSDDAFILFIADFFDNIYCLQLAYQASDTGARYLQQIRNVADLWRLCGTFQVFNVVQHFKIAGVKPSGRGGCSSTTRFASWQAMSRVLIASIDSLCVMMILLHK